MSCRPFACAKSSTSLVRSSVEMSASGFLILYSVDQLPATMDSQPKLQNGRIYSLCLQIVVQVNVCIVVAFLRRLTITTDPSNVC